MLDSVAGDLILTAAHCLAGGIDATFVAGFNDDAPDEDVWHIDAVYLDQRWLDSQDPLADFAIARVSREAGGSVQSQAGGGLVLGQVPKPGDVVTVTGYEMGIGGGPISCTATLANETRGFPSLPCLGLVDGLSGAPWIDGSTVTGLVGGLHGGRRPMKTMRSGPCAVAWRWYRRSGRSARLGALEPALVWPCGSGLIPGWCLCRPVPAWWRSRPVAVGSPLTRAVRLGGLARSGTVVVSEATAQLVAGIF